MLVKVTTLVVVVDFPGTGESMGPLVSCAEEALDLHALSPLPAGCPQVEMQLVCWVQPSLTPIARK